MLQLLAPALFTAALAGLLIPLVLHLWDQGQGRRVLVGSLRWLETVEKRRLRRIRFSDIWGFLLRSFILLLFALLLGQLVWQNTSKKPPASSRWILVAPELADLPVPDSLLRPETPLRLLAPGFPKLEEGTAKQPLPDYWNLLRELAARPDAPDSVVLIAYPYWQGFQGQRPSLPLQVDWIAPPDPPASVRFPAGAWKKGAEIQVLIAETQASELRFSWVNIPARAGQISTPELPGGGSFQTSPQGDWTLLLGQDTLEVQPAPALDLLLVYDDSLAAESSNLSAALQAAAAFTTWSVALNSLPLRQFNPEAVGKRQLIWLSAQTPPEEVLLTYRPESGASGDFLLKKEGAYLLRRRIDTRSLLESGDELPRALIREWLNPAALSFVGDRRLLPEVQAAPEYAASAQGRKAVEKTASLPLHQALWLLLAALFFAERLRGKPKG